MSHPNPHHDPENVYPDDNYKPVNDKKKNIARKMFNTHGSAMSTMLKSIRKTKKTPKWFSAGQGGGGLPPGRKDEDNE
jgi:hypothetical protein